MTLSPHIHVSVCAVSALHHNRCDIYNVCCCALQAGAIQFGHMQSCAAMVYNASDLLWSDGLEDIRTLFESPSPHCGQPMPAKMQCSTLPDILWFCSWKQLPSESHQFSSLPEVSAVELLRQLGMTAEECALAQAQLSSTQWPDLQKVVLPDFMTDAVTYMATQLPELPLTEQLQQHKLFAG